MKNHTHATAMFRCSPALAILLMGLLSWSQVANTQNAINPELDDRFTARLGMMLNELDGTITVLKEPLPETPIDVEDLGLDTDQTSPWGSFRWRFGKRWALNAQYDRFDQDGKARVEDEFNFDGVVYPVGARIDTKFRADAYVMDLSYAVWKKPNYEAGIGLGLHGFDLDMGISGTIRIGDETETLAEANEEFIAPVPNVRLFGTYAFSPTVSVTASGGWLSMSYGDWDGDFLYLKGMLEYRVTENWGTGVGYQYTDVDVEHNRDNGDFEEYDAKLNAIQAYVSYSF